VLSTEAEILGSAGELVSALKMFNQCVLPLCQCAQLVGLHVLRNTNLLIFSSLEAFGGSRSLLTLDGVCFVYCIFNLWNICSPHLEDGTTLGCAAGRGSLSPACSVEWAQSPFESVIMGACNRCVFLSPGYEIHWHHSSRFWSMKNK
jgi:hypothetical protein